MAYYDALIAKWATLTGTVDQRLVTINALTVNSSTPAPLIVPSYEIFNAIDRTDWAGVSAANQQIVRDILGLGSVDASPGTKIRTVLLGIFGVGTATRTALNALAAKYDTPPVPWWSASVSDGGGGLRAPVALSDLAAAGII